MFWIDFAPARPRRAPEVLVGVRAVLRSGGSYVLMCFSQHAVARGPRRSTEAELRDQFRGA